MKTQRKKLLLELINSELTSSNSAIEAAKKTAVAFSNASPSETGDREAYRMAADLAESTYYNLIALKKEVESCSDEKMEVVQPVCYVELDYGDDQNESCYLVNNLATIPSVTFITPQSIVGEAIMNKKLGDIVVYTISRGTRKISVSCKIVTLE